MDKTVFAVYKLAMKPVQTISSNVERLLADKIQHKTSQITENVEINVFIPVNLVMAHAQTVSSDVENTAANKIQPIT